MSVQFYVHSDYSLLQSVLTIDKLVKEARQLGIEMLALTDYNTTAGHYELDRQCRSVGIKPIFGVELEVQHLDSQQAPLVLIAMTDRGYQNLLHLASQPVPVPLAKLADFGHGLALLEGGARGRLTELIRQADLEGAERLDHWYQEHFGSFYYLRYEPGQKQPLVEHFRRNQFVLCQDVRYAAGDSLETLDVLAKIGRFEPIIPQDPMLSWEELNSKFALPAGVLEQTLELARACEVSLPREQILPPHPSGHDLGELVAQGAKKRYQRPPSAVKERLTEELSVIGELGFSDYFLIVADIVRFAKNAGIPVGPGRGSAAGSLVAYCLGITEVDPLRWGLLFERFLNNARRSRPDIDLDFCYERRPEVLAYVAERFGKEHVAQIGTYGTFSRRSAEQEIHRVLGEGRPDLAAQMEGLKRHRSTHAAGVIVTAQPVQKVSAVYSDREMPVTHLDMYSLEALGVLKIDLLGLRTLTLLRRIEDEIRLNERDFSLDAIPFQDQATFELLGQGRTLGIFQLESDLFQDLLRSLVPRSFNDLIALLALGRPGPLKMFQTYLKNRKEPETVEYLHPALQEILAETYGLILYQEQLMQIAHRLAGFSLGEADLFRRDLAKRDQDSIKAWRDKFCLGAQSAGLPKGEAQQLFQMTVRFSGYAFNKAHSVSYAMLTWRMAYLKANYPLEFFLTLLNESRPGGQQAELILDCQTLGLSILPPSIMFSQINSTREGRAVRLGLTAVQGVGRHNAEKIIQTRQKGIWPNFAAFQRSVQLEQGSRANLILAGACDQLGTRANLLKAAGEEVPPALELLRLERGLVGAYLSRHPASAFLPLVRHFQADLDLAVGEVTKPGQLDTPHGLVLYQGGQQLKTGWLVALFGRKERGSFQTEWAFRLGPTLLISPGQEELATLKEIVGKQEKARGNGTARPVVLRLGDGTYHLLPVEFWVTNAPRIEEELTRARIVFTWFDPWKETVS